MRKKNGGMEGKEERAPQAQKDMGDAGQNQESRDAQAKERGRPADSL